MSEKSSTVSRGEFISLMALLMSFVALTIDAMLPALGLIGESLNVANSNDTQLIIATVFFGMSFGLISFGPVSDSFGRKRAIHIGLIICIIGSVISYLSNDLNEMLLGRFLQGLGAASCRVVTVAMMRDQFEGREMGKVMSQIIIVFILVPALAPSVGQGILFIGDWRDIFGLFVIVGIICIIWLHFRQPETLIQEKRLKFSISNIKAGMIETLTNRASMSYMLTAGVIFGAFVGYLSSSQQILQVQYSLGDKFSLYFGVLALAMGLASFANSKLVMKFPMEKICIFALGVLSLISFAFYFISKGAGGHPELNILMGYFLATFFCIGLLFGNFNTLALQPLGHIAGTANSVIGSIQTLVAMAIGGVIGQSYDGTVGPLITGFLVCGLLSWAILLFNQRRERKVSI